MKYTNPELREKLASEYVLGTLHGHARLRFEQLLKQDSQLRALVFNWEQKLGSLQEAIPPVKPHRRVWSAIEKRIGWSEESVSKPGMLSSIWNSLGFWRSMSTAAMTATIVLAVSLSIYSPQPIIIKQYVAVITNAQQQASWLASLDPQTQNISMRVINSQTLPSGKDFELWMLPAGDEAPVSMGLLSATQNKTLIISRTIITDLENAKGLAVSLEPLGGSPTGQPTGPVLYQGEIHSLSL